MTIGAVSAELGIGQLPELSEAQTAVPVWSHSPMRKAFTIALK